MPLIQRLLKKPKLKRWLYISGISLGICLFCLIILNLLFPFKFALSYSTVVTDSKGTVIHAFLNKQDKWRMKAEASEISPLLKKTILFKEDRYFYYHFGVNPISLVRSVFQNLYKQKRVSGASTITMQVVRLIEPRRRTYISKLIEIFRAFQLEWKYSKDEIFRLYINLLPYGSNIEGVKSASVLYFKKNPYQLSLAEIAALSIIPNRPNSLTPGIKNVSIEKERNRWLRKWQREGLFTQKEIDDAMAEPLIAKRVEAPREAPHLAHRLKNLYRDNNISTNLVMNTQWKLENIVKTYVAGLNHMDIHNAACVVIDNKTKKVIAYIGSADFYNNSDGGQVNGANAVRQPGSALKPLLYGLCIDRGIFTPQTVIADVPINIKGYRPENYDQTFKGPVTVSYALENSLNIPAVWALNKLGKEAMISKLTDCGFKQVYKDRTKLGLSLILGGCGVTLEEMTGLFTTYAHDGVFYKPSLTTKEPKAKGKRLLSPAANYMVTEILAKISRPDLPVGFENSTKLPKIAWKTGTSYGRRDAWSIGYNDNYTVGVWVGNFSNKGVADLSGATIATPLLFQIFNTLDYNSDNAWFAMHEGCQVRMACSETGDLPGPKCERQRLDYFIPLISLSGVCEHMREFPVSADEKYIYCKNCQPETGYKKKWFRMIKPEIQAWYIEKDIGFDPLPPHFPDCDNVFVENAPVISFPVNGSEYFISSLNPEPLQLSCHVTSDVKTVYWYINDKFYQKAKANEKLFFTPEQGKNKISCTDDKGRNTDSWVFVRMVEY
jgi:penicillin-binding protein 1C